MAERFAAKVLVPAIAGACWIWVGAIETTAGYGRFQEERGRGAKLTSPHRWSWVHAERGRVLPPGVVIRHTCDLRICPNFDHHLAGTQADNVADSVRRGRAASSTYDPQRYVRRSKELRAAARAGDLDTVQRLLAPPPEQLDMFTYAHR